MNIPPTDQHPLRLTPEGELAEPIIEPQPRARAWRIMRIVGLLCLLPLALTLAVVLYLNPEWLSTLVSISIAVGVIRLWSIKPFRVWFNENPPGFAVRNSGKKQKYQGSKFYPENEIVGQDKFLTVNGESPIDGLFLLCPNHIGFISGHSKFVEKYAFDGEEKAVVSVAIPVFGCITAFAFMSMWLIMQYFAVRYIGIQRVTNIGEDNIDWAAPIVMIIGIIYLIVWMLLLTLKSIESEVNFRYLIRNGYLRYGYIVESFKGVDRHKLHIVRLKYRFPTPDGREITTVQQVPIDMIKELPPKDTPVAVLFADDGHYKLL